MEARLLLPLAYAQSRRLRSNPGVRLAGGSRRDASEDQAERVSELIDALNTDTEMVLVAMGADAETLTPVVWAKAAYIVQIAEGASDADALRVMLQEVLNRGRDAALVAALEIWR